MARFALIISPGRSGSSMVAGLFAEHGVWAGDCRRGDSRNPKGYFENKVIQEKMKDRFGVDWLGEFPEVDLAWPGVVKQTLERQKCTEPWLFKTGAFYWKVWKPFDPVFVKVWRPEEEILSSYARCGFLRNRYSQKEIRRVVSRQLEAMKSIDGPDIDTNTLVAGDYNGLETALKSLDIEINQRKTDSFINESFWNGAG